MERIDFIRQVEDYCKKRKNISEMQDLIYLEEVDFLCPLCGKHLLTEGIKKTNKNYQIAHIFPNSPSDSDMEELCGVELLGESSESYENKIALCKDDHWDYDHNKTREKYNNLCKIKKEKKSQRDIKKVISSIRIEEELRNTIENLSKLSEKDIKDSLLSYEAIRVSEKIEEKYFILRRHIEDNVNKYFIFIQKTITKICINTNSNFELVAIAIRKAYLESNRILSDKNQIFDCMSKWIVSQTGCTNTVAEIIVSYFVQNCEIYEKLP